MTDQTPQPDPTHAATPDPTAQLRGPLRRTLAGLWAERTVRAFWPAWSLGLFTAAALGFGVQDLLPPLVATALFAGLLLATLVAVVLGLWRFTPPRRGDALQRLDMSLPGRPLSALADSQALGADDPAATAVWRAHLRRMTVHLLGARPVPGDLQLARHDRFALRYVALTAFALSLLFGQPARMAEVTEIAQLPGRAEAVALGPSWEAWAQPPAYTGRPSLYLNEVERSALQLPEGTRITVRFYGQPGVMSVVESVSDRTEPDTQEMAQDFEITSSGRISVRGPAGRDWEIAMLVDQPPEVELDGGMQREAGGLMRQDFQARDDYGVESGAARITLDLDAVDRRHGLAADPDPREPLELDLPMPASGGRTDFTESLFGDLSQHPWANLPVQVAMSVTDARGQTGEAEPRQTVLPGRRFFDPMAAAVVELRRDILWSTENARRADALMRAIAHRPDDAFRSDRAIPRFRSAQALLRTSLEQGFDDDRREALARELWDLAILLEEGELADARERLERAQQRLDEAMRSGADEAEISELMDELREALRDYMRELARQPRERGDPPPDGEQMELSQDQLQELIDRIEELMQEGRMDEAAELMAQLNALLENLEIVEGDGQGGDGNALLEGLGDTLRDQQDLSDDTFREFQEQFDQGGPGGDPQGAPDPGEDAQPGPGDLADRQQALRDMLRDQQLQPMPGDGTPEGDAALESLEDAQRAMEQAEEALRDGDTAGALDSQADALEALREAMRNMNEALAQDQRDRAEDGTETAESGDADGRDPLGRSTGGDLGTDDDMVPGEETRRRAEELLQELRRRSAELDRPDAELDYLRRLLDRF